MLTEKELVAISKIFDEKFDPIAASLNRVKAECEAMNREISNYLAEAEKTGVCKA